MYMYFARKSKERSFWEPYAVMSVQCKYDLADAESPVDILLLIASCHVTNILLKNYSSRGSSYESLLLFSDALGQSASSK